MSQEGTHLLLLDHPLTDDLVGCGFDKAGCYPFSIEITLAIVGSARVFNPKPMVLLESLFAWRL